MKRKIAKFLLIVTLVTTLQSCATLALGAAAVAADMFISDLQEED